MRPPAPRFKIQRMMVVVTLAGWGVWLTWARSQGSWSYALSLVPHSALAWGLGLIAGFAGARSFGPTVDGPQARAAILGLVATALLASLYLAWGHHRAMYEYIHGLDRGFPYPDPVLNSLERWFDARHPLPPGGFIKLHGEYPRVGSILGILVLVFLSATGWLAGVIRKRPEGS